MQKVMTQTLVFALSGITAAQGPRGTESQSPSFDVIIKCGTVYDGTGRPPVIADVEIRGDRIAAIDNLSGSPAQTIVEANGAQVLKDGEHTGAKPGRALWSPGKTK